MSITSFIKDCKYWLLEKIKPNGRVLEDIPDSLQIPELCFEEVKQNGGALRLVSDNLITPELCMIAVKQDGAALEYVPDNFKTYELCLTAVRQNGEALLFVPNNLTTREIYLAAVQANIEAANYINTNLFPIKDWPLKWFNRLWNVELRRQFIRERGAEVCDQLDLFVIDENSEYKLVRFKYSIGQDNLQYALIFRCPSSNDTYFVEVPQTVVNVDEAVKFLNNGLNKDELAFES